MTLLSAPLLHDYEAYGMRIRSAIALPELRAAPPVAPSAGATLTIETGAVELPERIRDSFGDFVFDARGSFFCWREVGAFHVSADGLRIRIAAAPGVDEALLAFPLLGPVLSEVLRRRGMFVLHASAAAIDGAGVALLADKGTGKSSSAGALLRGGALMLADDLVAIEPASGMIRSGFPQIKLSEGNLAHQLTGTGWTVRPPVHARIDKVRVRLPDALAAPDTPARRIYLLERGTSPEAEFVAVPAPDRLPALLRFAFAPRFGSEALRGADAAEHFRAAIALVARIPLRILRLPLGLERMDGLADAIRADLAAAEAPV